MRERTWSLRGLRFAGLEWGEPSDAPVVFLHGFLDHAGGWARVARDLGRGALALDLRGHGQSAWVGPGETYHFAEYIADLDALVQALGGRVVLVGHSMGGTLGSMYAGARPECVERLAILDGLGLPDGGAGSRERLVAFRDAARTPHEARPMASVEEAASRLRRSWTALDEAFALALARRGTREVEGGVVWSYDPRHRARSAVPYRQDQHLSLLREITCPVLSIHPEHCLFAAEDVGRLEAGIRDLRVVTIAGAGHMLQLEAPELVARHLRGFLDAR
jgi:pimeloyl-ACP methyl ester carboxylesterase